MLSTYSSLLVLMSRIAFSVMLRTVAPLDGESCSISSAFACRRQKSRNQRRAGRACRLSENNLVHETAADRS